MTFIDQITLPIFITWIVGLILVFFRRDLDFLWKAFFLLIFLFYIIQFHEEIFAGFYRFKYNYAKEIVSWIYGLGKATYYMLLFTWPLSLFRIYYSAAGYLSEITIRLQVGLNVVYWIGFYFYSIFQTKIDNFLMNTLVHFLRFN
ncbi:MAG TPA: hypothetical protein PK079_06665 [Leptospiraceae bacterium]|nr:hypothetical protein [Leptospiraceae bacterium]HMW06978.1 hypothetical protein [Leptospiraceae bacterium]HMX32647.1 hypothetical protein [Leptospiraceae bacterium]HMY30374.1 hypothetical protein [Leptospiraceae bacterium]HMZ65888.1 hypothetical protein [Leptospiraceae bacterium]